MNNWKKILLIGCLMLMSHGLASAAVVTGESAADFTLTDTNGVSHSLSQYKGKHVVLEWLNHDCPFVRKHYDSGNMQALQKKFTDQGVVWASIISSAKGKQGYFSNKKLNKLTKKKNASPTIVLPDPSGDVGRLYGAKTTPHMFIIDPEGVVIYQGAIDSIAGFDADEIKQATNYVDEVLNGAISGQKPEFMTTKPYGCSVKY